MLGFLAAFVLTITFFGGIAAIVLYFVYRKNRPAFANGMLAGFLLPFLALLGFFTWCLITLSTQTQIPGQRAIPNATPAPMPSPKAVKAKANKAR